MPHPPRTSCHEKRVACQRRPKNPEDRFLLPRLKSSKAESKYRMLRTGTARLEPRRQLSGSGYSPPYKKAMAFVSLSRASASDGALDILETIDRQWAVTLKAINRKFFELLKPPTRFPSSLAFDEANIRCHLCAGYLSR